MPRKIATDYNRFRNIVRGKIREDLRKYVRSGEMIVRKRGGKVSVPLPQIDVPRFKFGKQGDGGVGQGDGEPGDQVAPGKPQKGTGPGEAGEAPGEHDLEVDVTLEELAGILGEELGLPNIEPRGKSGVDTIKHKLSGIRSTGPESLRHFKRTYRQGLRRAVMSGEYDPKNPIVIPQSEDKRYRGWKLYSVPETCAVMIYMMDVSGSMGDEQKEIVRIEAFWIDTWLRSQYQNIESVYIVHDAEAKEVDEHTFYHLRESGGTKISSAYDLCLSITEQRYDPNEWNIYPFHFSDGDNWGTEDTERCIALLKDRLLPISNLFCYGQVRSAYGSGKFKGDLDGAFTGDEKVVTTDIHNRDEILDSIRSFLSTGR